MTEYHLKKLFWNSLSLFGILYRVPRRVEKAIRSAEASPPRNKDLGLTPIISAADMIEYLRKVSERDA